MYNKWLADPEDSFASTYCAERPLSVPTFAFPVCPICRHIVGDLADKTIKVDLASILSSAEQCRVCSLLVRSFLDDVDENGKVTLFRNIAALRIGYRGRRAVRFSTPLGDVRPPQSHPTLTYHFCSIHRPIKEPDTHWPPHDANP